MRLRPKRKNESLSEYADAASRKLLKRMTSIFHAHGVDAVWKEIFQALCDEGQFVREVSPAAIVIYERYFSVAVNCLKEYPDAKRHEALVRRVKEDLAHHRSKYLQMQPQNFTNHERDQGFAAYAIIAKTLKSFA